MVGIILVKYRELWEPKGLPQASVVRHLPQIQTFVFSRGTEVRAWCLPEIEYRGLFTFHVCSHSETNTRETTEQLAFSGAVIGCARLVGSKLLLNSVTSVVSLLPMSVIIFYDTPSPIVFDYESCDRCGMFALSNYHCWMWCLNACHPGTEEGKAGGQPRGS